MRFLFLAAAMLSVSGTGFAAPPGSLFVEPAEAFPTQFKQDFRRSSFDDSTLKAMGPAELLQPSSDGLTIRIAQGVSEDVERIGVSYPLPLKGDADVRATVELLSFPQPEEGYGTGVILAFEDGVAHGATLQFLGGEGGNRSYVAHRFIKDAEGNYDHQVDSYLAGSTKAVLRLRREGSTLQYLVSEDDGATFNELKSIEFTAEPITVVQLYGQRGGKPNALNARFIEASIATPQVTRRSEVASPQPERSWFWWIVAGAAVISLGIVSAVLLRRRSA